MAKVHRFVDLTSGTHFEAEEGSILYNRVTTEPGYEEVVETKTAPKGKPKADEAPAE